MSVLCESCNGSGEGYNDGSRCSSCKGQGEFEVTCRECDCELTRREEQYLKDLCVSCAGECLCSDCIEGRR